MNRHQINQRTFYFFRTFVNAPKVKVQTTFCSASVSIEQNTYINTGTKYFVLPLKYHAR